MSSRRTGLERGERSVADAVSGALLGVLMGCLMALLGDVDQAVSFVVTGGILFATFGLLNGLRTDTSAADSSATDTSAGASAFLSSQPNDHFAADPRAVTRSAPSPASPERRLAQEASPAPAQAGAQS